MKPQPAWWEMLLVLLVLLFLTLGSVGAQGWQITWTDTNTEIQVDGYKLYYGSTSQKAATAPAGDGTAKPYDSVVTITPGTMRAWPLPVPKAGVTYYRMTAFGKDPEGKTLESDFSPDEAILQAKPRPPKDMNVVKK